MASNPSSSFDFSGQAKALYKRISSASGATPTAALAVAAIEVALREAFSAGQQAGRQAPTQGTTKKRSPDEAPEEEHCNHYFVDVDGTQVCIACRKTRKASRTR